MLKVKLLEEGAKAPTVAHPGEDLGYDLYALEDVRLDGSKVTKVRTGISAQASDPYGKPLGLLIRDRSSVASLGAMTTGGVIDAGYTGEINVLMTYVRPARLKVYKFPEAGIVKSVEVEHDFALIKAGDKIAQMVPVPVLTGEIEVVDQLTEAVRGDRGFGSSGQ